MANTLITQLNTPAVLQATNQRLATIVSLIFIIASAYLLAKITWMIIAPEDDLSLAAPVSIQSQASRQTQQDSFRKLSAANLFGKVDSVAPPQPSKAPETKLNLTLRGVLAAKPSELASAIIAQGTSGKEDIYSIGDKVSNGVLIKEIHPTYVVLDRNGRLETLRLPKDSGVAGFKPNQTRRNIRASSPASALKEIRGNILKNPTSFGDYALPVLVKENGKQIGYRLKPQKKGELLSELGIQSTDVIVQINGVKLDKPQNGISALRKLSTAKNLDIVVKRNGVEIPLNISLQ